MDYKLTKSPNQLALRGKTRYLAHTIPSTTYDLDDLSAELGETLGGGSAEVRYYEECRARAIEDALKAGRTVRIGGVQLTPVVRGGFSNIDSAFDAAVNSVTVASFTYGSLKKCLAEIVPENLEKPANPTISHIQEAGADAEETITTGRDITITGKNLKIDLSSADEGVELLNVKTRATVSRATVEISNYDSLIVSFAELPASGRYILAVRTRGGLDGEHQVVTASREIKVLVAD